jgi:hypothetical protein
VIQSSTLLCAAHVQPTGALTVTKLVAAVYELVWPVGEIVIEQATPDCTTVND